MYGARGAMLGTGGYSDGYEVGSKRQRMMDSNPYFAVSNAAESFQPYSYGGGFHPTFPVVRLRGLPFNCTDIDISKFFAGLDIVDVLLVNKSGRFSGEAFVIFAGPMQAEFALQRDHLNMGRRYVEVFRCKKQDYYNAVAAEVNHEGLYDNDYHGSPPPSRAKKSVDKEQLEYTEILKLRGLPFSVTKAQILNFFGDFGLTEDRIHIACRPDGKATGEAYVEFASVEEAKKAMGKDKMTIGSRYVELFPSKSVDKDQLEYSEIIKLRGLPFSVTKSEILDFFGEFALTVDRVHIGCRPDGKATGEAFVEFASAEEAKNAMCKDKMTIGSRYVELFPATAEEARRAESRSCNVVHTFPPQHVF